MQSIVHLGQSDPTIFAKCLSCSRVGRGTKSGTFFGKAYSVREWKRGQVCPNCGGALTVLYEVREDA